MHLIVPIVGFVVIAFVLFNADIQGQGGRRGWLAIGILVLLVRRLTGRSADLKLDE